MIILEPYVEDEAKVKAHYDKLESEILRSFTDPTSYSSCQPASSVNLSNTLKDISYQIARKRQAHSVEKVSIQKRRWVNPNFVVDISEMHNNATSEDYVKVELSNSSTFYDKSETADEFMLKNAIAGNSMDSSPKQLPT